MRSVVAAVSDRRKRRSALTERRYKANKSDSRVGGNLLCEKFAHYYVLFWIVERARLARIFWRPAEKNGFGEPPNPTGQRPVLLRKELLRCSFSFRSFVLDKNR